MVDVYLTFEMVALVLDNARQESADLLAMVSSFGIGPCEAYVLHTLDIFGQSGQTEATFGARHFVAVENLYYWIDEGHLPTLALGKFVAHGRCVDHDQTDAFADLRRGETHAVGFIHGKEHIVDKFLQPGISNIDSLGCLAEYGVSVKIYWKSHFC